VLTPQATGFHALAVINAAGADARSSDGRKAQVVAVTCESLLRLDHCGLVDVQQPGQRRHRNDLAASDPKNPHREVAGLRHLVRLRAADTDDLGGCLDPGRQTEVTNGSRGPHLSGATIA
jgi:hypothetical protein